MVKWLTTAPNPRRPATGFDAGQTGWKLHAIITEEDEFLKIKYKQAVCGLRAKFGWSLDMFIEDKCTKCQNKLK